MAKRAGWLLFAALTAGVCGLLTGCGDDQETVEVRRVERHDHVCTLDCHDHYYDGARRVTVVKHRHGPGCGHAWDGARWVTVVHRSRPVGHTCTLACRHYYDGDRVIVLRNHKHGPRCGHSFDGQRWVRVTVVRRD